MCKIKPNPNADMFVQLIAMLYKIEAECLLNRYSEMMRKAWVYVSSNRDNLLKYRQDGHYTIDNMLAERAVRPFTVKRKIYRSHRKRHRVRLRHHTLIETCKNVGLNVKAYSPMYSAD